jgi:hypothetical protein
MNPGHGKPTNTTTICKRGSCVLQRVNILNNAGDIVIYDNTAGSGTIIADIGALKVSGSLPFDAPFNIGLTIVTTGGGCYYSNL